VIDIKSTSSEANFKSRMTNDKVYVLELGNSSHESSDQQDNMVCIRYSR
jgi:hypothetical protein